MIHCSDSTLVMEGYLQIIDNEDYNWPNYLIVKEPEGEIVETGSTLKEIIELDPRKAVYMNEYFDDRPTDEDMIDIHDKGDKVKKYLYNNGIEYEY